MGRVKIQEKFFKNIFSEFPAATAVQTTHLDTENVDLSGLGLLFSSNQQYLPTLPPETLPSLPKRNTLGFVA